MKTIFLAVSALSLCGCMTVATAEGRAQLSSGHIGCMPDEITTSEIDHVGRTGNWVAECRGKRFICSYEREKQTTLVACAPKL